MREERADKYLMSQGLVRGACASQIAYGARCMYDGYIQGDTDRKSIDIKSIPQLYIRWLMIDGEKPSWDEYANKALEDR